MKYIPLMLVIDFDSKTVIIWEKIIDMITI